MKRFKKRFVAFFVYLSIMPLSSYAQLLTKHFLEQYLEQYKQQQQGQLQTYFYHCSKRVSKDGVVSKMDDSRYITFSNNVLYQSDAYGNITPWGESNINAVLTYCETVNKNHYYYVWNEYLNYPRGGFTKHEGGVIVSSDFSLLNIVNNIFGFTDVYYRTTEESIKKEKSNQMPDLIR